MPYRRTALVILTLSTLLACNEDVVEPKGGNNAVEENKAVVRRVVDEVFNRGNLAAADQLVTANWIDHNPSVPGLPPGPAGLKALVGVLRGAFPDLQLTIDDMVAQDDLVADRFTIRGTHRGDFNGIPATGKSVVFTGSAIHKVAAGRLVESWANLDDLGLLKQLGVIR